MENAPIVDISEQLKTAQELTKNAGPGIYAAGMQFSQRPEYTPDFVILLYVHGDGTVSLYPVDRAKVIMLLEFGWSEEIARQLKQMEPLQPEDARVAARVVTLHHQRCYLTAMYFQNPQNFTQAYRDHLMPELMNPEGLHYNDEATRKPLTWS